MKKPPPDPASSMPESSVAESSVPGSCVSGVEIRPVRTREDYKNFIHMTRRLYADDPNWIQPLDIERLDTLLPHKNPYYKHADVALWTAQRNGHVIGRISAQIDTLAQDQWGPNLAHFGFFEADTLETASLLLRTAQEWARAHSATRLQGPWSFSANMECGLLLDGFDTPPCIMMPHGRPSYQAWLKTLGFDIVKRMYAYELDITDSPSEKASRIVAAARRNKKITLRELDMRRFDDELAIVMEIFNEAWSDNWGYVRFTEEEARHAAQSLKPIIKSYRAVICEYDGEPVAFMITIPDINHKIRDLDGRLLPFGFFKLLYRMLNGREDRLRVPLMGVRKRFQKSPSGAAMAMWMIDYCKNNVVKRGGHWGELGWILEDNVGMNSILQEIGCKIYKTYGILEKSL